jgi:hypothetical protein
MSHSADRVCCGVRTGIRTHSTRAKEPKRQHGTLLCPRTMCVSACCYCMGPAQSGGQGNHPRAPAETPLGELCRHQSKGKESRAQLTGQSAKQSKAGRAPAQHSIAHTWRGTCRKNAYSAMHNVHSAKKLQQSPARQHLCRPDDHTTLSHMLLLLLRAGCQRQAQAKQKRCHPHRVKPATEDT